MSSREALYTLWHVLYKEKVSQVGREGEGVREGVWPHVGWRIACTCICVTPLHIPSSG